MPKVFRIMQVGEDGLPIVNQTARGLGVRPGVDIELDQQGNVFVNGKGMSVNPAWRDAPFHRIPERLRHLVPDARGPASNTCFRFGTGTFRRATFADGLTLAPDSPKHGTIAPATSVQLSAYEAALAATRSGWEPDEK